MLTNWDRSYPLRMQFTCIGTDTLEQLTTEGVARARGRSSSSSRPINHRQRTAAPQNDMGSGQRSLKNQVPRAWPGRSIPQTSYGYTVLRTECRETYLVFACAPRSSRGPVRAVSLLSWQSTTHHDMRLQLYIKHLFSLLSLFACQGGMQRTQHEASTFSFCHSAINYALSTASDLSTTLYISRRHDDSDAQPLRVLRPIRFPRPILNQAWKSTSRVKQAVLGTSFHSMDRPRKSLSMTIRGLLLGSSQEIPPLRTPIG